MGASKSKKGYWLGFDLGGTKMMAAVLDANFRLVCSQRAKTKGAQGVKEVVGRITELIQETIAEAGLRPRQLKGIGVGSPGPLDLNRGIVVEAPNLGWHHVPLKAMLEKRFRCRAVVANDVDAGTFGEYRFGAGRGARCVLGCFPGTGIGGGCVYRGRLLRGRVSSCLELGHLRVQLGGRLCGCGRRGCLETVASRLAIASDAAVAVHRGEAPILRDLAGTDLADMKSSVLAEAIRKGDRVVEQIVRHAACQLGQALAGVVNLLAPDVVVLGGGLPEAMPKLYLNEVRDAVRATAMKSFAQATRVVLAELGDQATVLGAAALAAAGDPEAE